MEKLSIEQRVKVIEAYYENGRSNKSAFRALRDFFGAHNRPTESAIGKIVKKFQETGSVAIVKPVRARAGRSSENIAAVIENLAECPNTSIRHRAQELHLSTATLHRILTKDLSLHEDDQSSIDEFMEKISNIIGADPETAPKRGRAGTDAGNQPAKIARFTDEHPSRDQVEQLIASNKLNTLTAKQLKAYLQGNDVKDISSATKAVLIEKVIEYHS